VSHNAKPFVLCGLPLRQPPTDQLAYVRRNGNFRLEVTAHPSFGLPFGQDRLIPIWTATLAQKQQNRVVHFESPNQLLEDFRLQKDGAQYRRVKAGFQRVFASTIFFGTELELKKNLVFDSVRFHFRDSMRLWFNRSEHPQPPHQESAGNLVTLSEAFYDEITAHPIPMEREVVAALAHKPSIVGNRAFPLVAIQQRMHLRREVHAAQKVLETGVGAQGIPPGRHFKSRQIVAVLPFSLPTHLPARPHCQFIRLKKEAAGFEFRPTLLAGAP
jgi:hypothetical protein